MLSVVLSSQSRITPVIGRSGKEIGKSVVFAGSTRASEVKAALKAADPSLKGNPLERKVREVLTGRTTLAWAEYEALSSAARSYGFQPDTARIGKSTMAVRFVKPEEPKAPKAKAGITREAALAALGITEEQFAILKNLKK